MLVRDIISLKTFYEPNVRCVGLGFRSGSIATDHLIDGVVRLVGDAKAECVDRRNHSHLHLWNIGNTYSFL